MLEKEEVKVGFGGSTLRICLTLTTRDTQDIPEKPMRMQDDDLPLRLRLLSLRMAFTRRPVSSCAITTSPALTFRLPQRFA